MVPLSQIPANSWGWFSGCIALLLFSYKSFSSYRRDGADLGRSLGWVGLVLGLSLGFFSLPAMFTTDSQLVRWFWMGANLLTFSSFLVQASILGYLLGRKTLGRSLMIAVGVFCAYCWWADFTGSTLFLTTNLIYYVAPEPSATIEGALILLLMLPAGYLFIVQGLRQKNYSARLKSVAIGMAYLIAGYSTGTNYVLNHGTDSVASSYINVLVFSFLFLSLLWPSAKARIRTLTSSGH